MLGVTEARSPYIFTKGVRFPPGALSLPFCCVKVGFRSSVVQLALMFASRQRRTLFALKILFVVKGPAGPRVITGEAESDGERGAENRRGRGRKNS
jgi:hypothetical protein